MSKYSAVLVAIALMLLASSTQAAPIIFDDFNTDLGHFNSPPNSSGTTNILHTATGSANLTSTVRTTNAVEGSHAAQLNLVGGGQASPAGFPRIRFLSGGGTPASNVSFTTTTGTDGWIGFYYKVPVPGTLPSSLPSGMQLHINLDGASADSGVAINAIMDGEWHLAEWNLDNPAHWIPMPGVGGDGVLADGEVHTIDSIYFRYPTSTGWTGYTGQQQLFIDFVAKSDSGSVAALVPEPASLGLLAVAGLGLIRRRRC